MCSQLGMRPRSLIRQGVCFAEHGVNYVDFWWRPRYLSSINSADLEIKRWSKKPYVVV